MYFSKEYIIHKLNKPLPGYSSHLKMAPPSRKRDVADLQNNYKNAKKSAVLILLYHENKNLKIIFIRRSFYVGIHAGQIAFPGGRFEKSDIDVKNTALREIEEEIGITAEKIEILGRISDIYVPPSNFLISVFVGYLKEKPVFIPDNREVHEILELDFKDFNLNKIAVKDFHVPSSKASVCAPYFKISDAEIWGATAMVMCELLDILNN